MKVLVVEDNRNDRPLQRLIVERHGYKAIAADNWLQGFDLAAIHRPDLILADALMSVLDGFHLFKKLKEDVVLKTIPFFFYRAAYTADKDLALSAFLGADVFIIKPKEPAELWQEIEKSSAKGGDTRSTTARTGTDVEYLMRYSEVVTTKLEEKVRELEEALAARASAERELRQAKEDWERTFESIGDIATLIDLQLRIIRINQKGVEILSQPREEIEGKYCYEIFRGILEPCTGCPVVESIKDFSVHSAEIVHTRLGKTFHVSASAIRDAQGNITGVVHFARDITEQKQLTEQLRQAQKMEAIGTLAGGIAHDFNNILMPILGYTEIALERCSQEDPGAEALHQILTAANRAKDLVRQILTFSRQAKGERLPLQIHYVVKEVLKLLRASIPTTIDIRKKIDPRSGAIVADPTEIHQVIMNLCTNAYHAMRETGGVLEVALHPIEVRNNGLAPLPNLAPGRYVHLQVKDTGHGMDEQVLRKIFDPYFTTKASGEGTGLGLSLVHGIVHDLGGAISVQSKKGVGSTFHLYFPQVVAEETTTTQAKKTSLFPSGNERVLVVDDEKAIAELEARFLAGLGYQAFPFTASTEALEAFRRDPQAFDLIVTDMSMPNMNGLALSKEILAIRQDMPIILCTGFSELIDEQRAKAAGVRRFLFKPIVIKDLAQAIRDVLDSRLNPKKSCPD